MTNQQQRELQRVPRFTRAIIETVREPLLVLDAGQRVQSASRAFYEQFDVKPEDAVGCVLFELEGGAWDTRELRELLREAPRRDQTIENVTVRQPRGELGTRVLVVNARHTRDAEDDSSATLLAIAKVTDAQGLEGERMVLQARQEVADAQIHLASIVESSDDAIVSKNLDGIVRSWNRAAERIFGYTAEEMVGRSILTIIPPDRHAEEDRILASLRRGERIEHFESQRRHKAGHLIDVSLTVSPLFDPSGTVKGASKIARDITEAKRMARALQAADRRKDEFLAMLAHELRNPLAAVSSAVELLGTEKGQRHLASVREIIRRQTDSLVRMVDDLLDVSRITRGTVTLRRERVDVGSVMRRAAETVRPQMEARRHEFRVRIDDGLSWVEGDAIRLEQSLVNLLTNAVKYTEPGGRIEMVGNRDGESAVISVRDNGIGISQEMLPEVFGLFTQSPRASETAGSGLGVGLTLVKSIVELHGGRVEARSDGENRGSEFIVRLPTVDEAAQAHTDDRPSTYGSSAARPVRILLVDDNEDAVTVLSMLLGAIGHHVSSAHDGKTALSLVDQEQFDVALLDIGMRGMDGYELARRLRGKPQLDDMLLVAVSGHCHDEDRRRSRNAGFDHHLAKPVDHQQLLTLLSAAKGG